MRISYSILSLLLFTSISCAKLQVYNKTITTNATGNADGGLRVHEVKINSGEIPRITSSDFAEGSKTKRDKYSSYYSNSVAVANRYFDGILRNKTNGYRAEIQVGYPPQNILVNIDSTAHVSWVHSKENDNCTEACRAFGTFDSSISKTYEKINEDFELTNLDNVKVSGDWVGELVTLNNILLKDFALGVSNNSEITAGVLGVGFPRFKDQSFTNYPTGLVKAGIINSAAYSIYLNGDNENGGNILFGGVDHTKYTGSLVTLPTVHLNEPTIRLTHVYIDKTPFDYEVSMDVILHTSTLMSYFPKDMIKVIADGIGAKYDQLLETYVVGKSDLNVKKLQENIEFTFGCTKVKIPLVDFFLDAKTIGKYVLLVLPSEGLPNCVLGQSFLKNVYTIFDIQNSQISIAQANLNSMSKSNVEAIQNNGLNYLNVPKAIGC